MPSNEEAERVILGSVLMNNGFIVEAMALLNPADFYSPLHKRVYAAMIAAYENGHEIDPITISEELKKEGSIESIGGIVTLTNLTYGLPHFSNIPTEYIRIVKEKKLARDLIRVCDQITTHTLAEEDDISVVLSHARLQIGELASVLENSTNDNFMMMNEIVPRLEQMLTDLRNGVSFAIPTGFPKWDNLLLDGFSKGDQHVIVGATGHGKSALALTCARNQATHGQIVGVVSREMSDLENAMRIASSQYQIPRWQMRKNIHEETYNALMAGMAGLAQLNIAIDIRTKTVEGVARQTKHWVQTKGLTILYVDYMQLLSSELKHGSRAEAVAHVSRSLKEIAMDNNIPVVPLSQFRRGTKDVAVEELLEYLKESSGIEQDASTVSYISIDNSVAEAIIKPAKLIVLKNRNGVTFTPVMLDYRGETFSFTQQFSMDELAGQMSQAPAPQQMAAAPAPQPVIPPPEDDIPF